jgi:hypothetical protein
MEFRLPANPQLCERFEAMSGFSDHVETRYPEIGTLNRCATRIRDRSDRRSSAFVRSTSAEIRDRSSIIDPFGSGS